MAFRLIQASIVFFLLRLIEVNGSFNDIRCLAATHNAKHSPICGSSSGWPGCQSSDDCGGHNICCSVGSCSICVGLPESDSSFDPRCPTYDVSPPEQYGMVCRSNHDCGSQYICCGSRFGSYCRYNPNWCPDHIPAGLCPPGGRGLCEQGECSNHIDATCFVNTCGTCVDEFLYPSKRVIKDCETIKDDILKISPTPDDGPMM